MNLTVFVSIDKRNFAHGRDGASTIAETTNYYETSAAAQVYIGTYIHYTYILYIMYLHNNIYYTILWHYAYRYELL